MTLAEFLEQCLADDEAVAQAAVDPRCPGTHWQWVRAADDVVLKSPTWEDTPVYLGTVEEFQTSVGRLPAFPLNHVEADEQRALPHIARHDPARVLAEVEAKRRALQVVGYVDNWAGEQLMMAFAQPYADRPGWDEDWRLAGEQAAE